MMRQAFFKISLTHVLLPFHEPFFLLHVDFQFRAALSSVVDRTDPRVDLTDFKMIGEGSTGIVLSAYKVGCSSCQIQKRQRKFAQNII